MKSLLEFMAVVTSVTLIGTAALAQHASGHNSTMNKAAMEKMMTDMMPKETDAGSTKELKQVHMKMMKDMHQSFTGKTVLIL